MAVYKDKNGTWYVSARYTNWKHEDDNAKMGRVAEKEIPGLHLETMEASENEDTKPHETGYTKVLCS